LVIQNFSKALRIGYILLFELALKKLFNGFERFRRALVKKKKFYLHQSTWNIQMQQQQQFSGLLVYLPNGLGQETAKWPLQSSSHIATCSAVVEDSIFEYKYKYVKQDRVRVLAARVLDYFLYSEICLNR